MGLTTSPSGGGSGDVSAAGNNAFTGINSFTGAMITPGTAMAALAIDVTKRDNTKTISADSVFTFSGTPATANTYFAMEVTNSAGAAKTLTIPSSWSMAQQGAITSVIIPANGILFLEWFYDGSLYKLNGDPPLTLNAGTSFLTGGTETAVSSATTTDLGAVASNKVSITGTVTITGFGTIATGTEKQGRFTGILTLTHNATSLILPGAANITTAAGDRFIAYSLGSGNWVVISYIKASGLPVIGSSTLTSTLVGYGDGSNLLTGEAAFAYNATSNILTVGGVSLGAGSEVSTIGPLVDSVDGTTPLNNINQVVATGTAFTLTTSYASLDFGTTDPILTIANAGTYAVYVNVQTSLVGTTATTQTVAFKLRRTNNTAADLTGSIFSVHLPASTVETGAGPSICIGPIKYTTTNTNDTVTVQGILSASLGAGTVTASDCTITAIRMY